MKLKGKKALVTAAGKELEDQLLNFLRNGPKFMHAISIKQL